MYPYHFSTPAARLFFARDEAKDRLTHSLAVLSSVTVSCSQEEEGAVFR